MQTDLQRGIIDGRPLRDWWENSPHGAFGKKCNELGIRLLFSDTEEVPAIYEVEIRYTYRGRGTQYVTVEAFNEKDAEKLALDKFDDSGIDTFDANVEDCEVMDVNLKEQQANGSDNGQ